jgi:putative solute:sodium symporter small subunit
LCHRIVCGILDGHFNDSAEDEAMIPERQRSYWLQNLSYIAVLLAIWAAVSYGASVLFADDLDRFRFLGVPLGFWVATQGSILGFLALVFVYVKLMNALDRKYGVYER